MVLSLNLGGDSTDGCFIIIKMYFYVYDLSLYGLFHNKKNNKATAFKINCNQHSY